MTTAQSLDADRLYGTIFDYAARIGGESDPEKLLLLSSGMARDLVKADRCSVWLHDAPANELWTKVADGLPAIRIAADRGLVGACVAGNRTIVVNDTSKDARFDGNVDRSSGYVTHSVLVLPLRSPEGEVMGALQVLNKLGGFDEDDVKLLGFAASFSASAITGHKLRQEAESARFVFRELEIARDVQNRLFPSHPPEIDGLDIAAYCRPASFVGGDYYDFLSRADSDLWLTVGDVSGKGISAAVLMASLQASLRTQFNGRPGSVPDVVSELNKTLCSSFEQDRYTTLFCAQFHSVDRNLTYVNAGHVAPLLLRSNGELSRLDCGGLPVGLFQFAAYESATIRLQPGDLLACFSDGITEATNADGEIWDDNVIEEILRRNQNRSSDELLKILVQAADDYTGTAEQGDDLTVVILRAT